MYKNDIVVNTDISCKIFTVIKYSSVWKVQK